MIKITIVRRLDNKVTGLQVKGHAGAGAYGTDIVCAAVSALAQSVILSFAKHLHSNIDYDIKEGYLRFTLQDPPTDFTEAVFSVAVLGFTEIEKNNPENVTISTIRG